MFIDSRSVEERAVIETTVCVIGAGVAGITLALEMREPGIDTCCWKAGASSRTAKRAICIAAKTLGFRIRFADGCAAAIFGGSSNCWGGWCRPLDPWDFDKRDWMKHSGWPFGLDELAPYYARTHALLKLGDAQFRPCVLGSARFDRR